MAGRVKKVRFENEAEESESEADCSVKEGDANETYTISQDESDDASSETNQDTVNSELNGRRDSRDSIGESSEDRDTASSYSEDEDFIDEDQDQEEMKMDDKTTFEGNKYSSGIVPVENSDVDKKILDDVMSGKNLCNLEDIEPFDANENPLHLICNLHNELKQKCDWIKEKPLIDC